MKKLKKRIIDIIRGTGDGILPTFSRAIYTDTDGEKTLNFPRFLGALFGWLFFVAFLTGKLSYTELLQFVKLIFTLE